jgi:hypothetical protein
MIQRLIIELQSGYPSIVNSTGGSLVGKLNLLIAFKFLNLLGFKYKVIAQVSEMSRYNIKEINISKTAKNVINTRTAEKPKFLSSPTPEKLVALSSINLQ